MALTLSKSSMKYPSLGLFWKVTALPRLGIFIRVAELRSTNMECCNGILDCLSPTQAEGEKKVILTHWLKFVCMYVCARASHCLHAECVRKVDAVHSYVCKNVGECGKEEKREKEYKRDWEINLQRRSHRPLKVELTSVPANVCRHPELFIPENCKALLLMVYLLLCV